MQTTLGGSNSCRYCLQPDLSIPLSTRTWGRLRSRDSRRRKRFARSIQARQEITDTRTASESPSAPDQPYGGSPPKPAFLGFGAVAWLFLLAGAATALWGWKRLRGKSATSADEFLDGGEAPFGQDSLSKPDYQAALARTRQAVCVHKALQFRTQGSPARAMVELRRALQENAIVREPLLNAKQDQEPLYELYKMHLQNTDVPAEYSTLLQLREMLAIETRAAENLEQEALRSGESFSI